MAFESVRARLGLGVRRRRYVDIESVRDLEDVSDPETTEDESNRTLRDWAYENPVPAVVSGAIGVLVIGVLAFYTGTFAPRVIENIWVRRFVAVGIIAIVAYRKGWSAHREQIADEDELVLKLKSDAISMKGTYVELPGEADAFIPIKGWRRAGHEATPYTNADLGAAMVEKLDSYRLNDSAAAVIRLQPSEVAVTETDWGTRVVQRTAGLRPDPQGRHTSLKAEMPDYDDTQANELAEQVTELSDENADLRGEIQATKGRVMDLKDRINEPIEEEVDKRVEQLLQFEQIRTMGRSGKQRDIPDNVPVPTDYRGNGSTGQSIMDEVDDEVSDDND